MCQTRHIRIRNDLLLCPSVPPDTPPGSTPSAGLQCPAAPVRSGLCPGGPGTTFPGIPGSSRHMHAGLRTPDAPAWESASHPLPDTPEPAAWQQTLPHGFGSPAIPSDRCNRARNGDVFSRSSAARSLCICIPPEENTAQSQNPAPCGAIFICLLPESSFAGSHNWR